MIYDARSKAVPLEKLIRQYDEIGSCAPEDDDFTAISGLPEMSVIQTIENFSYMIVSDRPEEFMIGFCKTVINYAELNKEYFQKWLGDTTGFILSEGNHRL